MTSFCQCTQRLPSYECPEASSEYSSSQVLSRTRVRSSPVVFAEQIANTPVYNALLARTGVIFKSANVDLYTARRIYWYYSTCKLQPQANLPFKTAPKTDIKVLQLNINGLRRKATELALLLHSNKVMAALIQETKMHPKPPVRR